jgi:hypothetical protein
MITLRDRLGGASYTNFRQVMLPVLLEDVRESMLFQHHGFSPDFEGRVLDNNSLSRWIGRGGLISWYAWPPRFFFESMLQGTYSGSRRSN